MTLNGNDNRTTSGAVVKETCQAIDAALQAKGGVYATYSCQSISWDDAQRGTTAAGDLSCWGANITDTRLYEKSGQLLYTIRSDNWNERLGKVDAHNVAVIVQQEEKNTQQQLQAITLADYLQSTGRYTSYAGVDQTVNLYDPQLDDQVSIRFQTTFLPVNDNNNTTTTDSPPSIEFCTESYNYNTLYDDSPRNAVLLCTTQGTAFSQDGSGSKKLFHHATDDRGKVHQYWLEAEQTRHDVGGAQQETIKEAEVAASRGKATASVIGIPAMGTRFNVLMTIQVPLEQAPKRLERGQSSHTFFGGKVMPANPKKLMMQDDVEEITRSVNVMMAMPSPSMPTLPTMHSRPTRPKVGTSKAARVSRGGEVVDAVWKPVMNTIPQRDKKQHITVTVVVYNTVVGGVPSAKDVEAAIDDMEHLYKSCHWQGRLGDDDQVNFAKADLTVNDQIQIQTKVMTQPYQPAGLMVENGTTFPTSKGAS